MASPVLQIIPSQQLTGSAAALYTSPLWTWTQINRLTCCNTDAATHAVTLYLVPSGGSDTAATTSTSAQAISPGQTWNSPNEYGQVLNPGDAIWGFADTTATVTIFASGTQFSTSG
jgi:hypothetical protein